MSELGMYAWSVETFDRGGTQVVEVLLGGAGWWTRQRSNRDGTHTTPPDEFRGPFVTFEQAASAFPAALEGEDYYGFTSLGFATASLHFTGNFEFNRIRHLDGRPEDFDEHPWTEDIVQTVLDEESGEYVFETGSQCGPFRWTVTSNGDGEQLDPGDTWESHLRGHAVDGDAIEIAEYRPADDLHVGPASSTWFNRQSTKWELVGSWSEALGRWHYTKAVTGPEWVDAMGYPLSIW